MTTSNKHSRIRALVLADAETDIVDLCAIVFFVRNEEPIPDTDAEARQETLALLRALMVNDGLRLGDHGHMSCLKVWDCSMDEALARVEREWIALGRDPTLHEIGYIGDPVVADCEKLRHTKPAFDLDKFKW